MSTLIKTRLSAQGFGFALIVIGLIFELTGLGLDAVLHTLDGSLAAKEGIFTLSNPGHLLFFAGLAFNFAGVIICLIPRMAKLLWIGIPLLLVSTGASILSLRAGESSFFPTDNHVHALQDTSGTLTLTEGSEVNISWNQLREIDRMLAETRDATQKYRDVKEAYAAGYKQEGPNRPGEGTHFINRRILDSGVFDPTRPTFLLYEHNPDWSYELAGVGWLLPKSAGEVEPPLFFAPLAAWHYHQYPPPGLCIWKDGTTNPIEEYACLAKGGRHWNESPWMLHVWLYNTGPEGLFSLTNSAVGGIQPEQLSFEKSK